MFWLTITRALALVLALVVGPASAQMTLRGVGGTRVAAVAYQGPGDIVSGATNWYGLRAYNAAYATGSNPSAIVCDSATFTTCSTINILANGKFDVATASGSAACATACVVKQLYDQVGTNHATCGSAAACPILTFNCIGSLPCLTFNGTGTQFLAPASNTWSPPVTVSWVAERTGSFTSFGGVFGSTNNTYQNGYFNTASTGFFSYNGTSATFTLSDGVLHAVQLINNGASSTANVDNTANSVAVGTGTNLVVMRVGNFNGNTINGIITEAGIWNGTGFNSTQQTNMCHNQRIFWGTTGSC